MTTKTVKVTQEHIDASSALADISPIERAIEEGWDDVKEAWADKDYTTLNVEYEDGSTESFRYTDEMQTYVGGWLVKDNATPREFALEHVKFGQRQQ